MSARIGASDLDQLWDRYVRLMEKSRGADVHSWEIFEGDPDVNPRVPWVIRDAQGRVLMTLGYTRRDAFTALVVAASTLAIAFGA